MPISEDIVLTPTAAPVLFAIPNDKDPRGDSALKPGNPCEAGVQALKKEFGDDIVFWGAGVNTQQTIAFGTPEETYAEVRERIDIFNQDGGMVFNSIHNIQATTPTENMLAMFKAIQDSAQ